MEDIVTSTPATVKAPADDMAEPFSLVRDAEHPVRWSPADGNTPAYLTLKGAVERLRNFYNDDPPGWIAATLERGSPLRSPFAFYQIDEQVPA